MWSEKHSQKRNVRPHQQATWHCTIVASAVASQAHACSLGTSNGYSMAKKGNSKRSKLVEAQEQLEQALASNATKDAALGSSQQQLAEAKAQVQALQEDLGTNRQLDISSQQLVAMQREAASEYGDYENRVLILQLQSLVEKYRILDVEALSEQNHELREEVLRLQAENMEVSRMLAESGQRARQDVARIHLALEATARETLASARQRLCAELHAQLDGGMRVLVQEHGQLQESMVTLAEQAAEWDKQYRCLVTDRRQFKIDAEVEQSMGDMQTRQIVLLKQQLDRVGLINQMLEVKVQEEVNRAAAAEGRAASLSHALARTQAQNQALRKLTAGLPGDTSTDSCSTLETGQLQIAEAELQAEQLGQQLSAVQKQLDKACAGRDRWKDRAHMYARAASQLQAVVQALQHWGPGGGTVTATSPTHANLKHIWSSHSHEPAIAMSAHCAQGDPLASAPTATTPRTLTADPSITDSMSTSAAAAAREAASARASSAHGRPPRPSPRAYPPNSLTPDPSRPSCTFTGAGLSSLSAPTIPDFNTGLPIPEPHALNSSSSSSSCGARSKSSITAGESQRHAGNVVIAANQPSNANRTCMPQPRPGTDDQWVQARPAGGIAQPSQVPATAALRPASAHADHSNGVLGRHPPSALSGDRPQCQPRRPLSAVAASANAGLPHALALVRASRGPRPSSGRAASATAARSTSSCVQPDCAGSTASWPTTQTVEGNMQATSRPAADVPRLHCISAIPVSNSASGLQDPFIANPEALDHAGVMSHIRASRLHSAGTPGRQGQQSGRLTVDGDDHGHTNEVLRPHSAGPPALYSKAQQGPQPQPHAITVAAAALFKEQRSGGMKSRPHTALQPRALRPGSVRYFGAVQNDPFLAMESDLMAGNLFLTPQQ